MFGTPEVYNYKRRGNTDMNFTSEISLFGKLALEMDLNPNKYLDREKNDILKRQTCLTFTKKRHYY